jgi:hypothetical protein
MSITIDSVNNNSTNAVSVAYELEPWMSKQQLSNHLSMSIRWIEGQMKQGMPTTRFGNRPRFKLSEVLNWNRTKGAEQ